MDEKIKKIIEVLKGLSVTEAEETLKKCRIVLSNTTVV